jgi:hypothetical protein
LSKSIAHGNFILGVIVILLTAWSGICMADSDSINQVHLVAPRSFLELIGPQLPEIFVPTPVELMNPIDLVNEVALGQSFVWIGSPDGLPRDLWIGTFKPSLGPLTIHPTSESPLSYLLKINSRARIHSAFLLPPKEFPKHNVDEEIRADFLPILEARDRFGSQVGYPGVLLSHVAPSLVGNRFYGTQCYLFFFEHPEMDMDISNWMIILESISTAERSNLFIEKVDTNYVSYHQDERVQLRIRIRNKSEESMAIQFRCYHRPPGLDEAKLVSEIRRVAGGKSTTEAICDFRPPPIEGLHYFHVDIAQDLENAELLAVSGHPQVVARREIGFLILDKDWETPCLLSIDGPNFVIDDEPGFYIGTHYYPSNVWWEWAWRDFRPALAARDFKAMRQAGNRIVRVWVDPILDEPALRAMDSAIWLAAQNGITLDICIFNQWVRDLGFERPNGEQVSFEFRNRTDFNLYSFSLRNLDLQREYLHRLACRWKKAGNIIFNLANETYVKDPDSSQVDSEVKSWSEFQDSPGIRRDTLLFRHWSDELTQTIREAGASQIVFPGYLFSLSDGGDAYLANTHAPLQPWHGYFPPEWIGQTIHYFDPLCSNRPLLLEEFGSLGWNNVDHYDAAIHYAVGAGAGAAMSYEWAVSWLSPEAPYIPLPLRDCLVDKPDPRWFAPIIEYARTNTSEKGNGIAPWPSGFGYGSIYHGTPFPAEAARAVWRLGMFGSYFARAKDFQETVYVIISEASPSAIETALPLFKDLWLEGIRFGVVQVSLLHGIKSSAHVLLLAGSMSPENISEIKKHTDSDAKIYPAGDMSWKQSNDLTRVSFAPKGEINCLTHATLTGNLFMFSSQKKKEIITAQIGNQSISAGLAGFTLVHASESGINLVEAAETVKIDGIVIFSISNGRLIAATPQGDSLTGFHIWHILATEPTEIQFSRKLGNVQLLGNELDRKYTTPLPVDEDNRLIIDDEMTQYVIEVEFSEH